MELERKHILKTLNVLMLYLFIDLPEVFGVISTCIGPSGHQQEIDSIRSICCDGNVYPRYNESFREYGCCGSITFRLDDQMCCGTEVVNRILPSGQRQHCCGTNIYKQNNNTLCCGIKEQIMYKNTGAGESCCGMYKYNTKSLHCCYDIAGNTKVYSKREDYTCCGREYYNSQTHDCVEENSVMSKGVRMCGTVKYNVAEKSCCIDKLYDSPRNHQTSCCGDQRYDITTHKCCWNIKPHVIPKDTVCCGSGFYDPRSQRCCMSKVVNITSSKQECCGSNLYNPHTEGCCTPGQTVFDKNINNCCKGSVVDINGECCGSASILPDKQVCCNNEYPIPKQGIGHNKCCHFPNRNKSMSYDNTKQRCLMQNKEPQLVKKVPLCGWKPFNKTKDLCCNMELIEDGVDKGLRCCPPGKLAYNHYKQICCNSVVYDKTERKSCRNNSYQKVCNLCNYENYNHIRHKVLKTSNVCKQNVFQFKVKRQRKRHNRMKLKGHIILALNGKAFKAKSTTLVLPCQCEFNKRQILVGTNSPMRKRTIRLFVEDFVIPYTRRLERELRRKVGSNC